ncbi:MAG: serine/threonine-protein kinase, partial [Planctomycetaceae bacterium]|nr:serine/threonine-protein kinase [Planctomycetaceae bacterium]
MNEREIFQSAVEIADDTERQQYLDSACGPNRALREQVEQLLRAHEAASQFLAVPAAAQLTPSPHDVAESTTYLPKGATASSSPDDEAVSLEFLEPSTKPGSRGRLAHYEVLEVLGRGAFGIVLKAFDEKLHRMVAIKVLNPELAATSPPRKRFLREAQSSAKIRHENIVSIYAVEEQPMPYIVMEYIPGGTLQQRLDQTGPLAVEEILRLGQQIALGLAAAHAQGLIHRDIKPANILMGAGVEERVKITDFGLARATDDASLTQSGLIAGTPMYMAPEQAKGQSLDHRTDLFSLGSVLYTMASGRPPFRAPNTIAVLKRVCEDTPRPIREVIPETPSWLSDIIGKLQAKEPDDRFQSAREVADVLGQYLAYVREPMTAPRPVPVA